MFARRTAWNLAPNALASALARRSRPFTDLTVSNPTAVGLEYPAADILAAWSLPSALRYRPEPRGLLAAREAVAAYYAARAATAPVPVATDDLVLTSSTSEAYAHLFRLLCDPGDRVHIPRPSYPLLDHLAAIADVELDAYPLWYEQRWHLDLAELERRLEPRSRAIVVICPNNPTGSYCSPAEWDALCALAAARSLALIVDEVFYDYAWPGQEPVALPPAAPLVFILNGLSKVCGLPQAKLAWIAVSGSDVTLRAAALAKLEIIADIFLSVAGPIQSATPALLALRAQVQPRIAARVAANLATVAAELAPSAAPLLTLLAADAGWNAVLRLPETHSDEAWAELLLERADVLVHPGHFYDFGCGAMAVVSLLPEPSAFAAALTAVHRTVRNE